MGFDAQSHDGWIPLGLVAELASLLTFGCPRLASLPEACAAESGACCGSTCRQLCAGFVEATLIPALVVFGATNTTAVLGVVTWRLLPSWLPIVLGTLAFGPLKATAGRGELSASD